MTTEYRKGRIKRIAANAEDGAREIENRLGVLMLAILEGKVTEPQEIAAEMERIRQEFRGTRNLIKQIASRVDEL